MSTKIQINTLAALERLIGGDNELEIEIRNSIVQEFAKKHLKAVANSDQVSKTLDQIKKHIQDKVSFQLSAQIASFTKNFDGSLSSIQIRPEIQNIINNKVNLQLDTTIRNCVIESIKKWSEDKNINELINKKFEYFIEDFIKNEVKKRIEKLKNSL